MGTKPWYGRRNVRLNPDHAASYIKWVEAFRFCRKLSASERVKYRLPTEAEWEYACRAGSQTAFCFGNSEALLNDYGWWGGIFAQGSAAGQKYPHGGGLKRPNGWGLYDMHGNVFEWCSDWYGEDYYQRSPAVDPRGPRTGKDRVYRGGSWALYGSLCRSAMRGRGTLTQDGRNSDVGFRVVRRVDPKDLGSHQ